MISMDILIAVLVLSWAIHVITYGVMKHRVEQRDYYLDYIFRHYKLNLPNPYVYPPGFDEKRCMFCQYPEKVQHATDCPWLHVRPFVQTVYTAVKKGL